MPKSVLIKPSHRAITEYYQTLQATAAQGAEHEMAVRRAFRELLATTSKLHGWTIIEEESHAAVPIEGEVLGKVRPDATFRDKNTLPRGYWEAKDSGDDLDAEIRKKTKKGYSLVNTIFEDTRTAVLYQNGQEQLRIKLAYPEALSRLLNAFFDHAEPDFDRWDKAVEDFKDRVPKLAEGLVAIVETAHKKNPSFKDAFAKFLALCQTALNPNIAQAAVDEMLIQHILTERLFRTIFNRADFTQRNVIASEVEKVITALTSQSFSREEYLKGLDRFYLAIENAARHLEWAEKQHFLNVIYERFFQGYSIKTADTMGIVYTPQPIVDFMSASVVEVLKSEFNKELGDVDVFILDPCTGTGNFVVNLLRRIPPKKLAMAYANNLFANEIMLMPYYIAALNIEHACYELRGTYVPFEGLCFVDTLDIAEHKQTGFDFFTQKNTERVERQKKSPITVVIGNPPYNMGQQNENDNNKNRRYKSVDDRIRATYGKDSGATLQTKLYDAYVKFFRWAVDRLQGRDGIVCYVSNNSFVEQVAFDGFRAHMLKDFTDIYHVDLHGNVRENPKLSGTTHNVFGIQVGVGITVAVRKGNNRSDCVQYFRVPEDWRKEQKLTWLSDRSSIGSIDWRALHPDAKNNWIVPRNAQQFSSFVSIGDKASRASRNVQCEAIFKMYSPGINSARDGTVYDFNSDQLAAKMEQFCEGFNSEVDRYRRKMPVLDIESFIDYDKLKWSRNLKRSLQRQQTLLYSPTNTRLCLYRPFTLLNLYFDDLAIDELGKFLNFIPKPLGARMNRLICLSGIGSPKDFHCIITDRIADFHLAGDTQCFPFSCYDEDGSNERENLTDWALNQFRTKYGNKRISKWDVFYYVYGMLHHPGYREKFADNLKRELPRIPFAVDFKAFATAGKKLADLHLDYEAVRQHPLREVITPGTRRSPRVESKMKLTKDKRALIVNESLTLAGIPPETFDYRLGNRSALDWIVDQYQVYTDKRTGITSDPNAWGEEHGNSEYIIELVARVITVSLETLKIVKGLPTEYAS